MGISTSEPKFEAEIQINLNKDKLIAGENLEGSISLNLLKECPPINLTLTLIGVETGFFKEQDKKNTDGDGQKRTFSEVILNQTFLLNQ